MFIESRWLKVKRMNLAVSLRRPVRHAAAGHLLVVLVVGLNTEVSSV